MLGILITVAVIAVVAYCVLKNYYPPMFSTILKAHLNVSGFMKMHGNTVLS